MYYNATCLLLMGRGVPRCLSTISIPGSIHHIQYQSLQVNRDIHTYRRVY